MRAFQSQVVFLRFFTDPNGIFINWTFINVQNAISQNKPRK
jgi:hypothetical protein